MADDIDDFVKAEMTRLQIPAVAFAIVKNGQVVRREAIGFADVAAKREAKVDDLYEIGSLTKQFTSMGVMFLVEGGRVNLDDSVSKYLHDAPAKWSAVKIRNLLVQDSGLPEYVTLPGVGLLDSFTRTQFMDAVGKLPVDFQPGAAWAYSNTNYALLGWLIEDVTKEPYTKFIEENIIRPIGMNHTVFAEKGVTVDGLARGYVMRRRMRMPSPAGAASIKADGALISNLSDMVKWDAALTSLRLLTRKSYQTIWTRAVLNSGRSHAYGMGWYLNQPGTHGYMGHSGTSAGYSAGISRFPGPRLTVILLANMYGVGGEAMTKKIAVLFDPTLDNAPFAAVPDPDPQRTERVKAAIQAISTNNPDDPLLDPEYAVPMKTRRTRMASFGTWGQIKQVDGIVFGGARQQGADTFLTYRVSSGPRNFIVSVLWTTQGKLAQATITLEEPTKPAPAVGKG
jgi:CubicO group peptidase (beta-lactamase class C family)